MPNKYRALRFVIGLYRVLAWIVLGLGIIAAIALIVSRAMGGEFGASIGRAPFWLRGQGMGSAIVGALFILIQSALLAIVMWAGCDLLALLLNIEHNTRETAFYLKGELEQAPTRPEPIIGNSPDASV